MANIYVPKFLKRTASQASFDSPVPPKKPAQDVPLEAPTTVLTPQQAPASSPSRRQFSVVHLPKLKWDLQRSLRLHDSAIDERAIQNMLMKSIQIALQAVGFESAESEALESFRVDVEECMYTRTTQELGALTVFRYGTFFGNCQGFDAGLSPDTHYSPRFPPGSPHESTELTSAHASSRTASTAFAVPVQDRPRKC